MYHTNMSANNPFVLHLCPRRLAEGRRHVYFRIYRLGISATEPYRMFTQGAIGRLCLSPYNPNNRSISLHLIVSLALV